MLQLSTIAAPFFPSLADLGGFEPVDADRMPADYRVLLAHDDHMTVTVEAFHKCLVDVRVLSENREGTVYTRTSLLVCQTSGKNLQFGIMRINLDNLTPAVQREITDGAQPLGRVLIRHNVLRHVKLHRLWNVNPAPLLRDYLNLGEGEPLYGRSACIVVEGRPAVELLEIPRT